MPGDLHTKRSAPTPVELWKLEDTCSAIKYYARQINERVNFNNHVMGRGHKLNQEVQKLQQMTADTLRAFKDGRVTNSSFAIPGTHSDISAYNLSEAVLVVYLESFRCIQVGLNQPGVGDIIDWIPIYTTYQDGLLSTKKWLQETYCDRDRTQHGELRGGSPHEILSSLRDIVSAVEESAGKIHDLVQLNRATAESRMLKGDIADACFCMHLMLRQAEFDCCEDSSIPLEFLDDIHKMTINPAHQTGVDAHIRAGFVNTALRRLYLMSFECTPFAVGDALGRRPDMLEWMPIYRHHQGVVEDAIRWIGKTYAPVTTNRKASQWRAPEERR